MKTKLLLPVMLLLFITNTFAQYDVIVEGNITTNTTFTADKVYLLRGIVRVQEPAILTIQPGTFIIGENTTQGSLIIKPGAKMIADGTREKPIVFTSEFALSGSSRPPTYGDWGGIILLGRAPINVPGGTAAIEGPGDSYGGNDPNDNSGIMRFVRIEYSGIAYSLNNEINGLTMGGVGKGTVLEYIQVSFCGDDSFEWFGGTVDGKYLISFRSWDDDFDTDFGFNGRLQYLLAMRDPEIADQSSSNGFESDNDGTGSLNEPRTSPTYWNVTLVGPKFTPETQIHPLFRRGMHLRRSSLNKVNNAIIMGWPTGILLDGANTINGTVAGDAYIKNSIIAGCTDDLATASAPPDFNIETWFTNSGGRRYASNTEIMLTNPFQFENPDFRPMQGSPALTGGGTPPADGFFDPTATFVGAFGSEDWSAGWANWNPVNYVTSTTKDEMIVQSFTLEQNYPNPFNPSTRIAYSLPESSNITLRVFDSIGREIAELLNTNQSAGQYEITFDASNLTSGVYFYQLVTDNFVDTKKMILMK